jgi:hypothetical protein
MTERPFNVVLLADFPLLFMYEIGVVTNHKLERSFAYIISFLAFALVQSG